MVSQGVSMLWSSFVGKKKVRVVLPSRSYVEGGEQRKTPRGLSLTRHFFALQSEERLPMKFSALVEHVTKKPVPAHVTHFVVEVMASDEDGEDVEVRILRGIHPTSRILITGVGSVHCRAQVVVRRKGN